jgi:hypothetical protein
MGTHEWDLWLWCLAGLVAHAWSLTVKPEDGSPHMNLKVWDAAANEDDPVAVFTQKSQEGWSAIFQSVDLSWG